MSGLTVFFRHQLELKAAAAVAAAAAAQAAQAAASASAVNNEDGEEEDAVPKKGAVATNSDIPNVRMTMMNDNNDNENDDDDDNDDPKSKSISISTSDPYQRSITTTTTIPATMPANANANATIAISKARTSSSSAAAAAAAATKDIATVTAMATKSKTAKSKQQTPFRQWKHERNQMLQEYMEARLVQQSVPNDDDELENEDGNEHEDHEHDNEHEDDDEGNERREVPDEHEEDEKEENNSHVTGTPQNRENDNDEETEATETSPDIDHDPDSDYMEEDSAQEQQKTPPVATSDEEEAPDEDEEEDGEEYESQQPEPQQPDDDENENEEQQQVAKQSATFRKDHRERNIENTKLPSSNVKSPKRREQNHHRSDSATGAVHKSSHNSNSHNSNNSHNRIPHISETTGTAVSLEQVNLFRNRVSLSWNLATASSSSSSAAAAAVSVLTVGRHIVPRRVLRRPAVKYAGQWDLSESDQPVQPSDESEVDNGAAVPVNLPAHVPLLPRIVLRPELSDDGPLATCYSETVVSMEIAQMSVPNVVGAAVAVSAATSTSHRSRSHLEEVSEQQQQPLQNKDVSGTETDAAAASNQQDELRRRAERALASDMNDVDHGGSVLAATPATIDSRPKENVTMPVFFYNRYAAAMDQILKEKPAHCTLLLSLQHVPAQCVFPYDPAGTPLSRAAAAGHASHGDCDWFRRQQQEDASALQPEHQQSYCLCIGDGSSMRNDLGAGTTLYIRFDDADMRITAGWSEVLELSDGFGNNVLQDMKKKTKTKKAVDTSMPSCREFLLQPCDKEGVVVRELEESENGPLTKYIRQQLQQQEPASSFAPAEPIVTAVTNGAVAVDPDVTSNQVQSTTTSACDEPVLVAPVVVVPAVIPPPTSSAEITETDTSPSQQKQQQPQPRRASIRKLPTGEQTESPHRKKPKPTDTTVSYIRLGDLQSRYESYQATTSKPDSYSERGDCVINLYGVVLGFGSPSKTKRGEWMVGIALVDETLPLENEQNRVLDSVHTVNINIFAKSLQDLPDIRYAGDVLRMHRVRLQKWKDEMQLMGLRMSSYVVCRDESIVLGGASEWSIRPTARTKFSLTLADESWFAALWQWGQGRLLSHPGMKLSQSFKLCDMQRQEHGQVESYGDEHTRGDLTVMVASVIPVPEDLTSGVSPRGFLRVWDGTGFPASDPLPLATAAASDAVKNGDPPSEAIIAMAAIIRNLKRARPDSNLQLPKAVTGRVANVAIWEDSHWQLVTKAVRAGSFIRLRNVQDSRLQNNGLRCLMVFCKSYLTPLPGLTYEVVELLRNHNERILGNAPLNPQSGILPLESGETTATATTAITDSAAELETNCTEPPRVAVATATGIDAMPIDGNPVSRIVLSPGVYHELADLLAGPVPTLFSGPVRIVGTIPSVSSLSSAGIQSICYKETGTGTILYRFAVRLQQGDPSSATVDAIVNGTVGESLVGMRASLAATDPTGALYNVLAVFEGKWQVHVRSVAISGSKYFLLDSATEI